MQDSAFRHATCICGLRNWLPELEPLISLSLDKWVRFWELQILILDFDVTACMDQRFLCLFYFHAAINRACHPGGHRWDYYRVHIYVSSQVPATHMKIGNPYNIRVPDLHMVCRDLSVCARSVNELQGQVVKWVVPPSFVGRYGPLPYFIYLSEDDHHKAWVSSWQPFNQHLVLQLGRDWFTVDCKYSFTP